MLYLRKQELLFRGHDESSASLNIGNCKELISKFNFECEHHLDRRLADAKREMEGVDILLGFQLISKMI